MGLSLVLLYAGDQHVNYAPTWCNYFWIYDAVRYLNSETKSYDLFVFNCFPQKHRFCIPICSMVLLVVVVVVVVGFGFGFGGGKLFFPGAFPRRPPCWTVVP